MRTGADMRRSVLFSQPSTTADGFAAQLQDTVVAALNRVAPIRTRKRRPPKPITRWLSADAVEAKRLRRGVADWRNGGSVIFVSPTASPTDSPAVVPTSSSTARGRIISAVKLLTPPIAKTDGESSNICFTPVNPTSSELMLRTLNCALLFVTILWTKFLGLNLLFLVGLHLFPARQIYPTLVHIWIFSRQSLQVRLTGFYPHCLANHPQLITSPLLSSNRAALFSRYSSRPLPTCPLAKALSLLHLNLLLSHHFSRSLGLMPTTLLTSAPSQT